MIDKIHNKLFTAAYKPRHINTEPQIINIIPIIISYFYSNNYPILIPNMPGNIYPNEQPAILLVKLSIQSMDERHKAIAKHTTISNVVVANLLYLYKYLFILTELFLLAHVYNKPSIASLIEYTGNGQ